jgi:hypothetical protein
MGPGLLKKFSTIIGWTLEESLPEKYSINQKIKVLGFCRTTEIADRKEAVFVKKNGKTIGRE